MEKIRFSDLPSGLKDLNFIVIQPRNALEFKKTDFVSNISSIFQQTLAQTLRFEHLTHITSIHCYSGLHNEIGIPVHSCPCGGDLKIEKKVSNPKYNKDWVDQAYSEWAETFITCSNCDMLLGTGSTSNELQNIIFHLMIKQVIPSLETCNYVDCSQSDEWLDKRCDCDESTLTSLKSLGVISVMPSMLFGKIDNGYFSRHLERYGLGFILKENMKMTKGFDGYDEWVKFLVVEKFKQIQKQHKLTIPLLVGPKTAIRTE